MRATSIHERLLAGTRESRSAIEEIARKPEFTEEDHKRLLNKLNAFHRQVTHIGTRHYRRVKPARDLTELDNRTLNELGHIAENPEWAMQLNGKHVLENKFWCLAFARKAADLLEPHLKNQLAAVELPGHVMLSIHAGGQTYYLDNWGVSEREAFLQGVTKGETWCGRNHPHVGLVKSLHGHTRPREFMEAWLDREHGRELIDAGIYTNRANARKKEQRHWRLNDLKLAVKTAPQSMSARLSLGEEYLEQGDARSALEQVHSVLATNPLDAEVHRLLAKAHLRQGNLSDAEKHARKALKLNPKMPENHVAMAEVCTRQGKIEEAKRHNTISQVIGIQRALRELFFGD